MKNMRILGIIAIIAIITMGFTSCGKKTGKYDYSKILNGDLSQFTGTWVNGNGDTLVLKTDGTFGDWERASSFNLEDGTNAWSVEGTYGWSVEDEVDPGLWMGIGVYLLPVGIDAIGYNFSTSEWVIAQTDKTKVRLFTFGRHDPPDANSMPNQVYYFSGNGVQTTSSSAAVTPLENIGVAGAQTASDKATAELLVGNWVSENLYNIYIFESNGKIHQGYFESSGFSGTWSIKGNELTYVTENPYGEGEFNPPVTSNFEFIDNNTLKFPAGTMHRRSAGYTMDDWIKEASAAMYGGGETAAAEIVSLSYDRYADIDYHEFSCSPSEAGKSDIIILPSAPLKDFAYVLFDFDDNNNRVTTPMYSIAELRPEKPLLLINFSIDGSGDRKAITFTDPNGVRRFYRIGEDSIDNSQPYFLSRID